LGNAFAGDFEKREDDKMGAQEREKIRELETALETSMQANALLKVELDRLQAQVAGTAKPNEVPTHPKLLPGVPPASTPLMSHSGGLTVTGLRLATEGDEKEQVSMTVEKMTPELTVKVRKVFVDATDETMQGKLAVLIDEKFFEEPRKASDVYREAEARGWGAWKSGSNSVALYRQLGWFCTAGFLRKLKSADKRGDEFQQQPGVRERIKLAEA
jgi:hypothetical protein